MGAVAEFAGKLGPVNRPEGPACRRARIIACALIFVCLASTPLYVRLGFAAGEGHEVVAETPFIVLISAFFPLVGLVIVWHRPEHPIGWIYLAFGFLESLEILSFAYATYGTARAPVALPGAGFIAWLSSWLWAAGAGLLATFSFMLFPDGRLPWLKSPENT